MSGLARYWKMWQIMPAAAGSGYRQVPQKPAQTHLQSLYTQQAHFPQSSLTPHLLSEFSQAGSSQASPSQASPSQASLTQIAAAGLSLRCFVSAPILQTCLKIAHLFGGAQFSYRDLLPFVLNDDGSLVVWQDGQVWRLAGTPEAPATEPLSYSFFSLKILQSYEPDSSTSMSLENWAYFKTKQSPEIKTFLSDYGFQHLSDWALLNRIRKNQLERLNEGDRHLIAAFHAVYRRDRRQQERQRTKCPEPSPAQLREMAELTGVAAAQILGALRQIAVQLRQYDVWSSREPLEVYDPETDAYQPRPDLLSSGIDELEMEKSELRTFLTEEFQLALNQSIVRSLRDRLTQLTQSKSYAAFATQFIPGLQLYYGQGLSLKEIAPQLKMTSWDQARRILNPGELLSRVRSLTVQQVLQKTLEKATEMGLTRDPPAPEYLKTLMEQIEAFADAEIFQRAAEELRAGKSRAMNSLYAQQLRFHLQQVHSLPR
jgi:hypothetical protein